MQPGKAIGEALSLLLAAVIDERVANEKQALLTYLAAQKKTEE